MKRRNVQILKSNTPVTMGKIKYGWNKIREIERVTGKPPKQLIKVVRDMEKEYEKKHR